MKLKNFFALPLVFVSLGLIIACTTEPLDMGPNGDARIREISFKNMTIMPDFNPYITNYSVVWPDRTAPVYGKVVEFNFYTKVLINDRAVRMETNGYKLPDFTDLTGIIKDDKLEIKTTAQDGLERAYSVTFLDSSHDAGITKIETDGVLSPSFKEGIAPDYQMKALSGRNNYYEIMSTNELVVITLTKIHEDAELELGGQSIPKGTQTKSLEFTLPSNGTPVELGLVSVSAQGDFTNVKTIRAQYVDPAGDNNLIRIRYFDSKTKNEIRFVPEFNYSTLDYGLTLDDVHRVDIEITKSQPDAKVDVRKSEVNNSGNYAAATLVKSDSSNRVFRVENLDVNMADKIEFVSTKGAESKTYFNTVTLFSRETYGFNGGIADLMRILRQQQAIPETSTNFMREIEGVITMFNHNSFNPADRSGFYLEDGGYGLYVWTYDGWNNAMRVGQRVKIYVKALKYWIGMPEVTRLWNNTTSGVNPRNPWRSLKSEIMIKKPRALFYQDGYEQNFGVERQTGRMFRYRTPAGHPIAAYFDESGIGNFNPQKAFKLFLTYAVGTFEKSTLDAKTYMQEGTYGSFFGVSFTDGDGPSLMVKGKEYFILDFEE